MAFLVVGLTVLSGCGTQAADTTSASAATEDTETGDETPAATDTVDASTFVGTWSLPSGAQCASSTTAVVFGEDGSFELKGLNGDSSGTYRVENNRLFFNLEALPDEMEYNWSLSADQSELSLQVVYEDTSNSPTCTYAKQTN